MEEEGEGEREREGGFGLGLGRARGEDDQKVSERRGQAQREREERTIHGDTTCRMWLELGLGCKRAHTESKQGNQVKQTGQTN